MLEESLGDEPQGIRAPRVRRDLQRSFRGNNSSGRPHCLDGKLERLGDHRADLRRQAGVQDERTVQVEKGRDISLLVLQLRDLRGVTPLRPAILAHQLLDMLRRSVTRNVHEHGFVRRIGHPRHRAYLRE